MMNKKIIGVILLLIGAVSVLVFMRGQLGKMSQLPNFLGVAFGLILMMFGWISIIETDKDNAS
jgi:hypothetical protein